MQKKDININYGYDNNGAFLKFEAHIPYKDLKTFTFPKSCASCPCGYMDYRCGRNIPFADEDYENRPVTCKLEQISIEDIVNVVEEKCEKRRF